MNEKLMKRVGYLILGSYAFFNIVTLFLVNRFPIGPDVAGPYSIYSSKGFFFAYHIWGVVLSCLAIYAMWKEIRKLFMFSLLLLMIVMFYPWFTAGPMDQRPKKDNQEQVDADSTKKSGDIKPVIEDSLPKNDSIPAHPDSSGAKADSSAGD